MQIALLKVLPNIKSTKFFFKKKVSRPFKTSAILLSIVVEFNEDCVVIASVVEHAGWTLIKTYF